ncbi:MAG: ATP-binding protein [Nitrospirota bacterium]
MFRSIRIKLLAILVLISILMIALVIFGINRIDRVARTASSIMVERIPLYRCSEQAILAATHGASCMDKAILIQNTEEMDEFTILEGQFRETIITFDMFIKAMIWGSEGEAFRMSSGGLTLASWERNGWNKVMVVKQAPYRIQQLAGMADIYYAGFSKYVKKVMRGQKRILRLKLSGKVDEIIQEEAEIEENIKKANRYSRLTNETLEKVVSDVHQYVNNAEKDIRQTQHFARETMLSFSGIILGMAGMLGIFFSTRFIVQPIKKLHEGTEVIGTGNLDYKVGTGAKDEIGQLSRAFDQMVENLKNVTTSRDRLNKEITERKRAENVLAIEKERLAVTLRSIGDGVIAADVEGKIVLMNRVAEKLCAVSQEEAVGKPLNEVFYIINENTRKRCENPVEKVLETGGVIGLANHTLLVAMDGTERIIADSGAPIKDIESKVIGVVLVFRDITEQKRMEEEIQKVQKLESVGLLAGGIAHDFNNILAAILMNAQAAKMKEGKDIGTYLEGIEKSIARATALTHQLLTFARGGAPIKKTTSIMELLKDTTEFALHGSNTKCKFSISDDLWSVECDKNQISQVTNNLIINANQAMPEGGTIDVQAENLIVEKEQGIPISEGKYIKISIKDEGIGIAKEHLTKIFDPYFTTKQKGSGLGLATAFSIIQQHNGYIAVESELGAGTCFTIFLPATEEKIAIRKEGLDKVLRGEGKILLMDDEEDILKITGNILQGLGYEIETTRDGAEAIKLYKNAKESRRPFDALIMDLTIPGGMGGKEAIHELKEIDPDVRAIVASGYSTDPILADPEKYGFCGVIVKPYGIEEVSKILHSVIRKA